jgi:hypothetical protein
LRKEKSVNEKRGEGWRDAQQGGKRGITQISQLSLEINKKIN